MLNKSCLLIIGLVFLAGCSKSLPTSTSVPVTKAPPTSSPSSPPVATQDLTFNLNSLNQVPPDDIISEIAYFGQPGGGGGPCMENYKKPTLIGPTSVEIMQDFYVDVCAVPDGDLKVQITQPDGVMTEINDKTWQRSFELPYKVDLSQPIGQYQFKLLGEGWQLSTDVEVHDADSARLFVDTTKKQVTFYHFQPNERVRLLFYTSDQFPTSNGFLPGESLKGWKEYQMDEKGQQIISLGDDATGDFIAVGTNSGQVPKDWLRSYQGVDFAASCGQGIKPIGIHPGNYVQVIANEINLVQLKDWKTIDTLKKGDTLQVYAGPICRDNGFYWGVSCVTGSCDGGIRESDNRTPLVQIIKELPTPDLSQLSACPGAQPTRLEPGIQAKVSKAATQLSLRDSPGASATKIHVIASGRRMSILPELPVCADGAFWWHVYVDELGFGGWVREGDNEDYWIDPLP